jgi:hypothetical protein
MKSKVKKTTKDNITEVKEPYQNVPINTLKNILVWLREGKTDREIILIILETFKIKEITAENYLLAAKLSFKNEVILDKKFNITQHIKRYDRDINKLLSYEPKTSSFSQSNILKTQALLDMVMLMQKKEKVLGFHQKRTEIKIKNNLNLYIKPLHKQFDFSKLSFEEKVELYNLIEKTKVNEEERFKIKSNPNKIDQTIEDIEYVEVKEKANVNSIKVIEEKIEKIEDPNIGQDKNIIDATNGALKNTKNLDDIRNSILNKIAKQ